VTTVTTEDDDKSSSIPTLPILETPPEFTARPAITRDMTAIPLKSKSSSGTSLESREVEQKTAWATDGHRVYKAPVNFELSLSVSEKSRRGSETSNRSRVVSHSGLGLGLDRLPSTNTTTTSQTLSKSPSVMSLGDTSYSMIGGSSISHSRIATQNREERRERKVGESTRGTGTGTEGGESEIGEETEKDEEYEARRRYKFAKKQGRLEAKIKSWFEKVIEGGHTGLPQASLLPPSLHLFYSIYRSIAK